MIPHRLAGSLRKLMVSETLDSILIFPIIDLLACSQKLCLKRFGHSLSSIDGKLYILGGALNDEECTDQMIELEFHT